eukprot:521382_1
MGSCYAVVALCAGGFIPPSPEYVPSPDIPPEFPNSFFNHFSVGLMEMLSVETTPNEACGDDTFGSSCGFPIDSDSFQDGVVNVCCHNGLCCYSAIPNGCCDYSPFFIGCTNTINICEIETCLSEGDRCED